MLVCWASSTHPPDSGCSSYSELQQQLAQHPLPHAARATILLMLAVGFGTRSLWIPLGFWLHEVQVDAPLPMRLAAVSLFVPAGVYGLARFGLLLLPEAAWTWMPWLFGLGTLGLVYGGLAAWAETDLRRFVTSLAISQLGLVGLGLASLNSVGMTGAVLYLLGQAAAMAGLVATLGMLELRAGSCQLDRCEGHRQRSPRLVACVTLFVLAGVGLPGLSGFAGLWMLQSGIMQRAFVGVAPSQTWLQVCAVASLIGLLLSIAYATRLIRHLWTSTPLGKPASLSSLPDEEQRPDAPPGDLTWIEGAALMPVMLLVLWLGVWPGYWVQRITPTFAPLCTEIERHAIQPNKTAGVEVPDAP